MLKSTVGIFETLVVLLEISEVIFQQGYHIQVTCLFL